MSQNGDRRAVKVHASASRGLPFHRYSLDASTKKIDGREDRKQDSTGERRRLSRVRHDDRGYAYVEWIDAPADLVERPKLEVERQPGDFALETERSAYNPYANGAGAARKSSGNTTRTDLR